MRTKIFLWIYLILKLILYPTLEFFLPIRILVTISRLRFISKTLIVFVVISFKIFAPNSKLSSASTHSAGIAECRLFTGVIAEHGEIKFYFFFNSLFRHSTNMMFKNTAKFTIFETNFEG